jgi:hypothetical protein
MSGSLSSKMAQMSQAYLNITVTLKETSSTNSGMKHQLNRVYKKLWIPNLNGTATLRPLFFKWPNQIVANNCNFILISKVKNAASMASLPLWQLFQKHSKWSFLPRAFATWRSNVANNEEFWQVSDEMFWTLDVISTLAVFIKTQQKAWELGQLLDISVRDAL